jgi:NADPH:quinone reductase-like Zn-dependent oxidoreductase
VRHLRPGAIPFSVTGTEETIMATNIPDAGRELRSLVTAEGTLELSLADVPVPEPKPNEVIIRVEAAPINPSDLGLLFAGADMTAATRSGPPGRPVVTAPIAPAAMRALAARVGISLPVGNEGAGTVIAAGSSAAAQALLGHAAAVAPGGMYTEYRCVDADLCLELPDGVSPVAGASSFVNPLTALGMIETMRNEGHSALVHTAAASNLGQMLNRLCIEEQVPLVNIVRKHEQEEILRAIGARYVCNSSSEGFMGELTQALVDTSATVAFDAIGGGELAGRILTCMEAALAKTSTGYSTYGSTTHKQVYIYGGLDRGPTVLRRNFGMAWGIGGWLLTPFLRSIGPARLDALRQRVRAGLETTFASTYTKEISLAEALEPEVYSGYARHATGEKYLITPTAGGSSDRG